MIREPAQSKENPSDGELIPAFEIGGCFVQASMSNATRPMVELREITKRFGSFVAARDVNLKIQAGEFLTLLGPSGCGKTTLLRMISGFATPTQDSVWLDGVDVNHLPPYRRDVESGFSKLRAFSASHGRGGCD